MPSTLLLADDSVTIQRVIELTFADEDINVVAVSDGDQAIARLDAQPPDIVLADVGMPGKNGYEVAQYVKRSPRLAHIPVVLLTGAFEPVDQARASEAGCDGVLAKPFEPQLVISRVKELLGHSKEPAPRPAERDAAPAPPAAAEEWTPPPVDESFPPPPPAPVVAADAQHDAVDLANYFDRLDAAFANLSHPPSPHPPAAPEPFADEALQMPEPPTAADASVPPEIDWFGPRPPEPSEPRERAETPAALEAPAAPVAPMAPETPVALEAPMAPVALEAPMAPVAPVAPVAPESPAFSLPEKPVPLPPLADAFAALLAAEQGDTAPAAVAWPAATPSGDALVDQISRRVLDQISGRIEASVRDAVADLVSDIAERLIREEIERIKAAIK